MENEHERNGGQVMQNNFDDLLGEVTNREDIRQAIIKNLETATGAICIIREPDGATNVHWIGLDTFMALSMQYHFNRVRDAALDIREADHE